jgi:hypothetical protein
VVAFRWRGLTYASPTTVEEAIGMAEQDTEVEEPTERPASKRPAAGDEHAYEDSWYQVLRRLAPGDDEG